MTDAIQTWIAQLEMFRTSRLPQPLQSSVDVAVAALQFIDSQVGGGGNSTIVIGNTTIGNGTNGGVLYDNGGVLGCDGNFTRDADGNVIAGGNVTLSGTNTYIAFSTTFGTTSMAPFNGGFGIDATTDNFSEADYVFGNGGKFFAVVGNRNGILGVTPDTANSTPDLGLSRLGPGNWAVGNGTAGDITGNMSLTGLIEPGGDVPIVTTTSALNNGAASGAGTLTNAPTSGNPTKWIAVNDNGTIRHVPAW